MKEYTLYLASAMRKMKHKGNNEVSYRLTPKEKQSVAVTCIVAMIPVVIVLVTLAMNRVEGL